MFDIYHFYLNKRLHVWGNWFAKGCWFFKIDYLRFKFFIDCHRLAFQLGRGEIIIDYYPHGHNGNYMK